MADGSTMTGSSLPVSALTRRAFSAGLLTTGLLAGSGRGFAQTTPRRGGTVRLALFQQSTGDTFDSARYDKGNDYIRGTSVYSYLTRMDEQGQAQPEVAESWEANKEATRWIFTIRKGITFSDGAPLTTDDIIFSLLRHREDKVASTAKQLIANITSITADGPNKIVIELAQPDVDLPILVGIFQFALVKNGTYDFSKPIGTGAFTVKEFQPGIRTVLVRNPNFWKQGQPYIDQFEMFPIPDASARANALLSGDVDMILELRGNAIEQVAKSSNAEVFVTPSTRYTAIQAAVDRAPVQQHRSRARPVLSDRPQTRARHRPARLRHDRQ